MFKWYLLSNDTRPNMLSGFENEAYSDWIYDSIYEFLDTDICPTVKVCNSDLSNEKEIKCLVIGNSADTQLKTMQRTALIPRGIIKAGMYVIFEDSYWIVDGYPGNCIVYDKITMKLCQYKLRWQNEKGEIIERWANFSSASKYDVGENGTSVILVSSNNYIVVVPQDKECSKLYDKRLFVDKNDSPTSVFKFTRDDSVLYTFNENKGGVLSFVIDKVEYNPEIDNQDLRICDYFEPIIKDEDDFNYEIISSIKYKFKTVYIGKQTSFEAMFRNTSGEVLEKEADWVIESEFNDSIQIEQMGSKINILIEDERLDGKSFNLILKSKDGTSTTSTMNVNIQTIL